MKRAVVFGAGGFIGSHMVNRLKDEGYFVCGIDLKTPEFSQSKADVFIIMDLRDEMRMREFFLNEYTYNEHLDEIYQFAADMGGAGYIFSGFNDTEVMTNSATINLNLIKTLLWIKNEKRICKQWPKVFYSSSACIYPKHNQEDPNNPMCKEDSAYPANPDSEYGWEKLFSERLYAACYRNHKLPVFIARYHNVYGPESTFTGGREKAPAAICRKIAKVKGAEGDIEIWGDGKQTRSYLFIGDCIDATRIGMGLLGDGTPSGGFIGPLNIGSEEMISVDALVDLVAKIAKKNISIKHIDGPVGVRGRNSNNDLIRNKLGWDAKTKLEEGMNMLYNWVRLRMNFFIN